MAPRGKDSMLWWTTVRAKTRTIYVLRLAPYLAKRGYFKELHFTFLVVGHTKNVANCLFNILKKLYRMQNIFTMGMVIEAMTHELTIPTVVDWQVFKNWDKYLNQIYKAKML
jgi:hypothetical protein